MSLLEIKKYPEPILRKKSLAVDKVTAQEVKLLECMLYTMYNSKGIGLAAPQVGISKKIIVADIGEGVLKLINPMIIKAKGQEGMAEGCLSVPDVSIEVNRASEIVVVGLNEKGKLVEITAKGLLARVIQHEIDHLKGKLIIDYAGLWKKMFLKPRPQEL